MLLGNEFACMVEGLNVEALVGDLGCRFVDLFQ